MTTIPKTAYSCPHCNKLYRRKRERDLHQGVCEMFDLSLREREKRIEEDQDAMSVKELQSIVKVLVREQTKMRKEITSLKQIVGNLRKKVTAEEFLATQPSPPCDLATWAEANLVFNDEDFATFEEHKIDRALEELLLRQAPKIEDVPYRCFTKNTASSYCFSEGAWRKTNEDDFKMLVKIVNKSMLDHLQKITEGNQSRMGEDGFSLRYNTSVQKVMACMPRLQQRLTIALSNRTKMSLANITTVEYTI